MSERLLHKTRDCAGDWVQVSARSMRGIKGKPKTGRHIYCDGCKAFYPDEQPYQKEFYQHHRDQYQLRRALEESAIERKMSAALSHYVRDLLDGEARFDADELASKCMGALRDNFLMVSEDLKARYEWQDQARKLIDPVTEQIKPILDGAFNNWRIRKITLPPHGGDVHYHVELEQREPSQEVAVEARCRAVELPRGITELHVRFCDRPSPDSVVL